MTIVMGPLAITRKMSLDQKANINAAILRAADKGMLLEFPRITREMDEIGPCIGYMK